jgi:hypothetical protein
MLSQSDIEFIKANRTELVQNRTVPITLFCETVTEFDEYTGEPIAVENTESVNVIWKEVSAVASGERDVVNGVELKTGDVQVTFDVAVDLSNIVRVENNGVSYAIVTVDEKGLGAINRRECIVRRST